MSYMFNNCTSFDQNLGSWDILNVTTMVYMLTNAIVSTSNYDSILIGWDSQSPPNNVSFYCSSTYTAGGAAETARTSLINSGWNIIDNGSV